MKHYILLLMISVVSCGSGGGGSTSTESPPANNDLKAFFASFGQSDQVGDMQLNIVSHSEVSASQFEFGFFVDAACLFPLMEMTIDGEVLLQNFIYTTTAKSNYFLCSSFSYNGDGGCATEASLVRSLTASLTYSAVDGVVHVATTGCMYNPSNGKELLGNYAGSSLTSCTPNSACSFSRNYQMQLN